jgi:hypothetical protein
MPTAPSRCRSRIGGLAKCRARHETVADFTPPDQWIKSESGPGVARLLDDLVYLVRIGRKRLSPYM